MSSSSAVAAVEAALQQLEEQGITVADVPGSQGHDFSGAFSELRHHPETVLGLLSQILAEEESTAPDRPNHWRRIYSAMHLLKLFTEAELSKVLGILPRVPALRVQLENASRNFECVDDRCVTLMVRQKAQALHTTLFNDSRSSRSVSRQLRTTDRFVAGLVRAHRDDDSTDSSPSRSGAEASDARDHDLMSTTPVVAATTHAQNADDGLGNRSSSSSKAIAPSRGTSCLAVARCGGTLCAGNPSPKQPTRRSWAITPMACFFGGFSRSDESGTPWVCAVLPNDSGSEDGDEHREPGRVISTSGNLQTSYSVGSTATPGSSPPIQPPSIGGSESKDSRSESLTWSADVSDAPTDRKVPNERWSTSD